MKRGRLTSIGIDLPTTLRIAFGTSFMYFSTTSLSQSSVSSSAAAVELKGGWRQLRIYGMKTAIDGRDRLAVGRLRPI